jgi:S-adenosyl methyltransferase
MADNWLHDAARRAKAAALVDPTMPNPARVGDALSGGRNNFEADRRAARTLMATSPVVSGVVPALRAFHQRAVRYLVAEAGIRQFLDIGTRLTMTGNTHEVAQSLAPDCRIVYASSDPVVLSHARALAMSTNAGAVAALDADPHYPRTIIAGAAETLDLGRPVAVLLMATLAFVLDDALAAGIVQSLVAAVPAGSHVALHHQASDMDPGAWVSVRRWNAISDRQMTLRSRGELARLLAGLDLVPPGLVPITEWHPEPADPRFEYAVPVYGAVGRKS